MLQFWAYYTREDEGILHPVLVIGTGPLMNGPTREFNGQAMRTWQFYRGLQLHGNQPHLAVLQVEGGAPLGASPTADNLTFIQTDDKPKCVNELRQLLSSRPWRCVVAVNLNAAYMVALAGCEAPLWADLNGYTMGEAQAKAHCDGDDGLIEHFATRQAAVLRAADRFSAASQRQAWATIGELGLMGRLSGTAFGCPLVTAIPNAPHEWLAAETERARAAGPRQFRGVAFPADSVAVLWSGGFNTWVDIELLTAGFAAAAKQAPQLHLVVTGGAIAGHYDAGFEAFNAAIQEFGLAERATLLGWVPSEQLPRLYAECDAGLNVDADCAETELGARNRITNFLGAGLPVVTTQGSEVTYCVATQGLGWTCELRSASALCNSLLHVCEAGAEERQRRGAAAAVFASEHWNYERTTEAVAAWCRAPQALTIRSAKAHTDIANQEASLVRDGAKWRAFRANPFRFTVGAFLRRFT